MPTPMKLVALAAVALALAPQQAGSQDVGMPLTQRIQALVDEATQMETSVLDWERRATQAESEAARMRKENDALRCAPSRRAR